jgi:predicted AAA+ superfamily ATPase
MISRRLAPVLLDRLGAFPAVALLGPRQVGKTTLALALSGGRPSVYLDLESPADRAKLDDPIRYLGSHADKLVILDEVHRAPELFATLRGIIDAGRRSGRANGRFLLLGSASMDLLRQTGESLAGRIACLELGPLDAREVEPPVIERLWIRGGFPDSFLAGSDAQSATWRANFIRTYLERDIPALGPRVPAETMRRLWTMLAHNHGGLLNQSELARSLAIDARSVGRYLDLMVDLLLARRLAPFHANVGKRLVKSPKVYLRDSGIVHGLLGLRGREEVLGHPVAGASWEGFVIESVLAAAGEDARGHFYRTAAGAEIDLVIEGLGGSLLAIEVKRGADPRPTAGFHQAVQDLGIKRAYVVYPGPERFPLRGGAEAIGLRELVELLAARRA